MPNANGHGGPRPGSGRPRGRKLPKTLAKEAAREYVRVTVTSALQPLLEAQIANALGLSYLVVRDKRTGKFLRVTEAMARVKLASHEELVEVWEKDPNVTAFADLLDRAIDRPKEQPQEVTVTASDELLRLLQAGRARAAAARLAFTPPALEADVPRGTNDNQE
jgi:hypothetical protein